MQRKQQNDAIITLFDEFIDEKIAQGLSKATVKTYRQTFNTFCIRMNINADTPAGNITLATLQQYISLMQQEELSKATINHYITHYRMFAYWLMNKGIIGNYHIKLIRGQEEKVKYYTEDELQKLLQCDKKASYWERRTYYIVQLILGTGIRPSTISELTIDDINFTEHLLTLRHLKNKSVRELPMSQMLERALKNWLNEWQISNYLFPNADGTQLTYSALRLAFDKYLRKRDIQGKGIKGLRHSFARECTKNGCNAFQLQYMMTHSNISTTQRYITLFANDIAPDTFTPLDKLTKERIKRNK